MFAEVIIDQDARALDKIFEYIIPDNLNVGEGDRVLLPFSNRIVQAFVVKVKDNCEYDKSKLKKIVSKVDEQRVVKPEMLELMKFMAKKNHLTLASILRLFIPAEMREGKVKELFHTFVVLENEDVSLSKSAKKQAELLEYLKDVKRDSLTNLLKNFGASAVNGLLEKGAVRKEKQEIKRTPFVMSQSDKSVKLNYSQQNAIEKIKEDKTYLLHGVTGSGKTEVYMNLIERVLERGKNAIMLVPEISLTPQIMSNFKARFGENVALLHSGLSAGEKFDEWKRLFSGEARIAIGARSAIFAPLENLGIIIIDEEHEQSYISESNPRYDTHDVIIMLRSCLAVPHHQLRVMKKQKRENMNYLNCLLEQMGRNFLKYKLLI